MRKVTKIALVILLALITLANIVAIITSIGCGSSQGGATPEAKCEEAIRIIEVACPGAELLVDKSESDIAEFVVRTCPDVVPFVKRLCPYLVDQIDRQASEL